MFSSFFKSDYKSKTQLTKLYSALWRITLLAFLLLTSASCSSPEPTAENLSTPNWAPQALKVGEGFVNPVGYYETAPRFSWKLAENAPAKFQHAYQVQVASSPTLLNKTADLWDSTKVSSSDNAWVTYQGKALTSRQKVYWRVKVWDENDKASRWSDIATVELGLLTQKEWQAHWIRHPETSETYTIKRGKKIIENKLYRPQYLRTGFNTQANIKKARLYITSKGVFTSYINGQRVSNDVMTPGWTPYLQRIETLTYDVTHLINKGENVLAATVAEGWYTGRILSPQPREVKPSALLAQLEIEYDNGTTQKVVSNEHWHVSLDGPIRSAGNYDGEFYDANFEMPGWNNTNFDDSQWTSVITQRLAPEVALTPKRHAAPKTKVVLPAIKIVEMADAKAGVVVFDMGQNMLGVPEINIPVIANQKVTLRFSEALEHNKFYTKNLRSAKATDYYVPAKNGDISYTPTFTFHGYRYIEISGFDATKQPSLNWVKGLVQHSDFEVTASFESSHSKLNKLAQNVVWGLRGNFLDIPTDCPQRDERLGWTGDAQVFAAPSMYMADVYGFWSAWLQSIREEQDTNGRVPNFIPTKQNKHTKGASSGWGDVAVVVPWELYLLTGDKNILAENYEMIQGWLGYHQSQAQANISNMNSFRDWLQPYPQHTEKSQKRRGDTPQKLISTAYYAHALDYAAKVANELGHLTDANAYEQRFEQVKQAFRDTFYDEKTQVKGTNTQTSYLLPLAFGLFDHGDVINAQQHLIQQINAADNHLRTGFLGTPLLAPVLQQMGQSDLMYELLLKETYPSWFYSINNGATTTWERWNSYSTTEGYSEESMNSLNHYAYGAVAKWFYEGILGINSLSPGFKEIRIEPQFTKRLSQAKGSYITPQGKVSVEWTINNEKVALDILVPKNTTANIVLPTVEQSSIVIKQGVHLLPMSSANGLSGLTPGQYRVEATIKR